MEAGSRLFLVRAVSTAFLVVITLATARVSGREAAILGDEGTGGLD